MFKALRSEFKDIVTALSARQELVTFSELHSFLLSHEFIHASVLPKTRANTTSKITEDEVATTREVEEEIVVADKVITTIHPPKISGPHRTLARVVKFVMVGASHHITPDLASLHHVEDYNGMDQVQVGNGQGLPIYHTINSTLSLPSKSLALTNILHDRASTKPLLSGQSNDGLYSLKLQASQPRAISKSPSVFISSRTASTCWHLCLGHPHK
ncbi:hypothetical protein KY289_030660 [Solanum tuberosum]|nr:hypothetical protein KY289_030660 [Solanum tuberosum]